jgi:8-oxo-dGTP diphosphatase
MPHQREILKIGLAVTNEDRLLVVRKKGGSLYILPGGKPEPGEDDLEALARELDEELGVRLDTESVEFLGSFSDTAADLQNTTVTVRLYAARLLGDPTPRSEIENLKWFSPGQDSIDSLAPSLQNKIVPFLSNNGRLANCLNVSSLSA